MKIQFPIYLWLLLSITYGAELNVEFQPQVYYSDTATLAAAVAKDPQPQPVKEVEFTSGHLVIVQIGRGSGRTVSRTYIYAKRTEIHPPSLSGLYLAFCYVPYGDYVFAKKSGEELLFTSIYRQRDSVVFRLAVSSLFFDEIGAYERARDSTTKGVAPIVVNPSPETPPPL